MFQGHALNNRRSAEGQSHTFSAMENAARKCYHSRNVLSKIHSRQLKFKDIIVHDKRTVAPPKGHDYHISTFSV